MNRAMKVKMSLAFGAGALATGLLGMGLPGWMNGVRATPVFQGETDSHDPISYRDVVKKVVPSVVSIETKSKAQPRMRGVVPRGGGGNRVIPPGVPDELRRFFEQLPEGNGPVPMPDEEGPQGVGSGFVIDSRGTILTNAHVVDGAEEVTVRFQDGRKFVSRDFKSDPKTDIAVIRLSGADNLPALPMGNSDTAEVGDRVLAVGAPLGLAGTVTHGIISHKGRNMRLNMYEDFLQTDAAINPGNSGGPLVNMRGEVIGVNSAIKSRTGGFQGIGLAIASNLATKIKDKLIKDGVVKRGYLGVQIRDIDDPALASKLNLKEAKGVLITQVFDQGPAAQAGVQPGDVVVAIGGKSIRDGRELQTLVADAKLGSNLGLQVVRDGSPVDLNLKVVEQPKQYGLTRGGEESPVPEKSEGSKVESLGLELSDLSGDLAEKAGFRKGTKGALVTRVESGSAAYKAGLRSGVVLQKVDGKPVTDASSASARLGSSSQAKGILLQVLNPEGDVNLVVIRKD